MQIRIAATTEAWSKKSGDGLPMGTCQSPQDLDTNVSSGQQTLASCACCKYF